MTINLSNRLTATHKIAKKFDDGDHWQEGFAFLPFASASASRKNAYREQMQNSLETENIIGEILDNEQNAIFGREPDWQVVAGTDALANFADETEAAALDYWNDHAMIGVLREANRLAGTQERAVVRAYIPRGLVSGGNDRKKNLREAMELLRFEVLPADHAAVLRDAETLQKFGILKKKTQNNRDYTELVYLENGETIVTITENTNYQALAEETLESLKNYMPPDSSQTASMTCDLGGELFYFELARRPLVTESIISNQKDVNLCLTMKNRLTYQAAYRDFFFFNAKQPVDKDGKPAPIKTGGKSANFIAGEDIYDETTGKVAGYANASMNVIEPSDPAAIIKSKEASAFAIYNQASQVHLTRADSALASGVSKRESRFSFEKKCGEIKQTVDALGRWMLKILVLFAADNLGQSEKYKSLRFDFNCRIDAGAPDSEEIKQAAQDVKDGLLSEETYLSKYLRLDDADAEKARIIESEKAQINAWQKRLETAKAMREMGLPVAEWVKVLYPDDEQKQAEMLGVFNNRATT